MPHVILRKKRPASSKYWQACNKHELDTWLVLATSVGGFAVVTVVDKFANVTESGSVGIIDFQNLIHFTVYQRLDTTSTPLHMLQTPAVLCR